MPVETRGARKRRPSVDVSEGERVQGTQVNDAPVFTEPDNVPVPDLSERYTAAATAWKRIYASRCMTTALILSNCVLELIMSGSLSSKVSLACCPLAVYSLAILFLTDSRRDPTNIIYYSEATRVVSSVLLAIHTYYKGVDPLSIAVAM
jgi:hypothetical protein